MLPQEIMPPSMNCLRIRLPRILTPYQCRPFSSVRIIQSPPLRPRNSSFHSTGELRSRKRKERNDYFSSTAPRFLQQDAKAEKPLANIEESLQGNKRKTTRSQAAKNSLRRVAVEAQQSRDGKGLKKTPAVVHQAPSKVRHSFKALPTITDCLQCIDCDGNLRR